MPKLLVETWVDVYSMLTDVFSMPSDLVLSDICLDDILQTRVLMKDGKTMQ